MSPALNGSSLVWHFECGNTKEIHDGTIFNFNNRLSQMLYVKQIFHEGYRGPLVLDHHPLTPIV